MDEVKAMARAGENVGKAVGTGLRTARRSATAMSKQAAATAERELANRGIATDELQEKVARKTTGMSRRQLAKQSRKTRRKLAKSTRSAGRDIATRIDPGPRRPRRKWLWGLLMLVAIGAVAAAVLSRRPEELPPAEAVDDAEYPTHRDSQTTSRNGSTPQHDSTSPLSSDLEK